MAVKNGFIATKKSKKVLASFTKKSTLTLYNTAAQKGALFVSNLIRDEIENTIKNGNGIRPKLSPLTVKLKRLRGAQKPHQPLFESGNFAESYTVIGPKKSKGGFAYTVTLPRAKVHNPDTRGKTGGGSITLIKLAQILTEGGKTATVTIPARPYMQVVAVAVDKKKDMYSNIIKNRIDNAIETVLRKGK